MVHSPHGQAGRALGGHATSRSARAERLLPSRLRPIIAGLEAAFRAVEEYRMHPRTAGAMATVAVAIVRVYQAGEAEERLRDIEANIAAWQERDRARWQA